MRLLALALVSLALLVGCVGRSHPAAITTTTRTLTVSARSIPGAPNTPRWLRVEVWRIAAGLGDSRPEKIAVTLNLNERGRTVDRVWMRGHFVCNTCVRTSTVRLRLVGYTFDARTHDTLSASGYGG